MFLLNKCIQNNLKAYVKTFSIEYVIVVFKKYYENWNSFNPDDF